MNQIKSLVIIDYSCHPFSLDLANHLAKKQIKISYFFSKQINLTGDFYKSFKNKYLSIIPIDVGYIPKHQFFKRRLKEIEFGKKVISKIKNINPQKVLLANLPIDPLFKLIKFCNNYSIDNYFWIQDIYYLAIKNVLKKNLIFYYSIGFFIYKFYFFLERYCFLNSTKNIVITKKFLNFFPKLNKSFCVENWIPFIKKDQSKFNKLVPKKINKKKFTFIYTGTLSYKHHSNNLIMLAKTFKDCNIIILSNDKFAKELLLNSKKDNIDNIYLFNLVAYNSLHHYFKFSDIGLVNLANDSNDVCVPSKVLTYYKYGLPVLASMPLSNPASTNIKKFKTGLVSNSTDSMNYFKNAKKLKKNNKIRKFFSKNAKKYAREKFQIENISKKFEKIMDF